MTLAVTLLSANLKFASHSPAATIQDAFNRIEPGIIGPQFLIHSLGRGGQRRFAVVPVSALLEPVIKEVAEMETGEVVNAQILSIIEQLCFIVGEVSFRGAPGCAEDLALMEKEHGQAIGDFHIVALGETITCIAPELYEPGSKKCFAFRYKNCDSKPELGLLPGWYRLGSTDHVLIELTVISPPP